MIFTNPYLRTWEKLDLLANWIIVQSILYYNYDVSLVTDHEFDSNCYQYVELADNATKDALKKSRYFYIMRGFDCSTGFDLYDKLDHDDRLKFEEIAQGLIKQFKLKEET